MSGEKIHIVIQGRQIEAYKNESVLAAARRAGIDIPALCYHDALPSIGSCRLCLVKVEGYDDPVASCRLDPIAGMNVTVFSDELTALRRAALELILVNHPLDCPICDKAGECLLQELTFKLRISDVPYNVVPAQMKIERNWPLIERNDPRCVRCLRCITVCREVVGAYALELFGKGYEAWIDTRNGKPLNCEFCGNCIQVCPVGALLSKPFLHKSRVWDLSRTDTTCGFCAAGCQFTSETREGRVVRIVSRPKTTTNKGMLCARAFFGWSATAQPERLTSPLVNGRPSSWNAALDLAAGKIKDAISTKGPESIAVLGSGRLMAEEAFAATKLAREVIRTPHVLTDEPYLASLLKAAGEIFGHPLVLASVQEPANADAFLVMDDIAARMPVAGYSILETVRRHDAKLVSCYSRTTKLSDFSHAAIRHLPGAEPAVILGIFKALVSMQAQNIGFLAKHSEGFSKFLMSIKQISSEALSLKAGCPASDFEKAAVALAGSKKLLLILGAEAISSMETREDIQAALMLLVAMGNPNGLTLSLDRADSLGSVLFGLNPSFMPGLEPLSAPAGLSAEADRSQGYNLKELVSAAEQGKISALLVFGSDPLSSSSHGNALAKAMEKIGFVFVVDPYLSVTGQKAHVVLPGRTFLERTGHFVSYDGTLRSATAAVDPVAGTMPDLAIIANLASRLCGSIPENSSALYCAMRQDLPVLASVPEGPISSFGIRIAKSSDPERKYVFEPPHFDPAISKKPDGSILVATGPLLPINSIFPSRSPELRAVLSPTLLIHPNDAKERGIENGSQAALTVGDRQIVMTAKVTEDALAGCVFASHGFAEAPVRSLFEGKTYGYAVLTAKTS